MLEKEPRRRISFSTRVSRATGHGAPVEADLQHRAPPGGQAQAALHRRGGAGGLDQQVRLPAPADVAHGLDGVAAPGRPPGARSRGGGRRRSGRRRAACRGRSPPPRRRGPPGRRAARWARGRRRRPGCPGPGRRHLHHPVDAAGQGLGHGRGVEGDVVREGEDVGLGDDEVGGEAPVDVAPRGSARWGQRLVRPARQRAHDPAGGDGGAGR